jgi:hypothetical protein
MTFALTDTRRLALIDAILAGQTVEDAAAALGTTGRTVYRRANRDASLAADIKAAVAARDAVKVAASHSRMHGTATGYQILGCREPCCTKANTARAGERRRRLRATRDINGRVPSCPEEQHGTANGYANWQCRCSRCKVAWADGDYGRAYP